MTKKVLILLLAISMVCSSLFAAFALDNASANEGVEQPSNTVGEENEKGEANAPIEEIEKEEGVAEILADANSSNVELEESKSIQPTPVQSANSAPKGNFGTVKLEGQWTGESSRQIDPDKYPEDLDKAYRAYNSPTEEIGPPAPNGGLLRGLAKTFLGWSNKEPVGNGKLAEGARLYSPHDKIGMVKGFESGIPTNAKLYAVYFSINDPKKPFPTNKFLMGLAFLSMKDKLEPLVNENTVRINKNILAEDTLLNTKNASNKTNEKDDRTIIDYYSKTDDLKKVHEVVLEAEFTMNDTIAMLVYKNPSGSNAIRPILSRNYKDKYEKNDFSTASGKKSGYTYMDLVVNLDPELKLPDGKLYMEFDAYSWRPLYVLDADNNPLNIVNPKNGISLGNDSSAFKSLVSKSPETKFAVDLSNAKLKKIKNAPQQITLRTVLREGTSEKVPEDSITPLPGKTIAETILSNMKLRTLKSEEIRKLNPKISVKESNKSVVIITDKKALELAKTDGKKTLKVTGYIEGYAMSDAGIGVQPSAVIERKDANTVDLGYTRQLGYFVETHRYETLNEKGEVIDTQIVKIPAQQGYASDMYSTQMKLREGFKLFSVSSPNKAAFSADGKKISSNFVEGSTLSVEYVYQKTPKQVEKKISKTVKTGDTQSMHLSIALAISCLAGVFAIRFKKSKYARLIK